MVLTIRCPQGHKLTCPDDRAGQSGKCPKCGSGFRVPESNSDAQWTEAVASASDVSEAATQGFDDAEDAIVFLCPNGHKLHGTSSLQGKPGQCPHCESRFLIPNYDDEEEFADEGFADTLEEIETPALADAILSNDEMLSAEDTRISSSEPIPMESPATSQAKSSAIHPMARVAMSLWGRRTANQTFQLRLKSGQLVSAGDFLLKQSSHVHGLFVVENSNRSYALTAVAWDCVEQITLDGLAARPTDG